MKRSVVFLLVLLLCAALPLSVLATSAETGGFESVEPVTAPALYGEQEQTDDAQTFGGQVSIQAPRLYDDAQSGLSAGVIAAIVIVTVAAVAVVVYFLLRKKK